MRTFGGRRRRCCAGSGTAVSEVERGREYWVWVLAGIVGVGILSRVGRTGFLVLDKYLGDALYAAMVYVVLKLTGRVERVGLWACALMVGIELFQLTGIAAGMMRSDSVVVRLCAVALGTHFGWGDLAAYGVGIWGVSLLGPTGRGGRG